MSMSGPRETTFHASLNRPNLMMGGDRELVLLSGIASVLLIFDLMTWWSIVLGIIFFPVAVSILARIGKVDPLMRSVSISSFQYKEYYPARARLTSPSRAERKSWL
jgi:type IV secretion system protein TrbD